MPRGTSDPGIRGYPPSLGWGWGRISSGAPKRQKDPGGQLGSALPPLRVLLGVPSQAVSTSSQRPAWDLLHPPQQPRVGTQVGHQHLWKGRAQTRAGAAWPLGNLPVMFWALQRVSAGHAVCPIAPLVCGTLPSQAVSPLATGLLPETWTVLSQRGASLWGCGRAAVQAQSSGPHTAR